MHCKRTAQCCGARNDAKTTNDNGVVGKPAVGSGLVGLMERGKSGWGVGGVNCHA